MATNNLLAQLTYATPAGGGGGIVVTQPIPLMTWHLASTGAPLTATLSTNPGQSVVSNFAVLTWAATKVIPAGNTFFVPRDYDEAADHLKIRFVAEAGGTTDTPALDCSAYTSIAPSTDVNPTKTANLSQNLAYVEMDLSGNSLVYGTSMQVNVFPEAHGTDTVLIWHADWEYKSMIVAHDEADRA